MTVNPDAAANPHGLPWHVNPEEPRVVVNTSRRMVGAMDTEEQARLVAEAVSAGDVDARREVTRLTALVEHYRHRMRMTPSERQSYLGEDVDASIQPERHYDQTLAAPARAYRAAVRNALATTVLGGTAEEALRAVDEATAEFERQNPRLFW